MTTLCRDAFAEKDDLVSVEHSRDVGNILYIQSDCISGYNYHDYRLCMNRQRLSLRKRFYVSFLGKRCVSRWKAGFKS